MFFKGGATPVISNAKYTWSIRATIGIGAVDEEDSRLLFPDRRPRLNPAGPGEGVREPSGRHHWEQFKAAIAYCERHHCLLVISYLGKRVGDLALLKMLAESDVEFEAPGLTRVGLARRLNTAEKMASRWAKKHQEGIRAAVKAGTRYGYALGDGRRRGKGDPDKAAKVSAEIRSEKTKKFYSRIVRAIAEALKKYPGASNQDLANALNAQGELTTRNKPFTDVAVLRIRRRYP